MRSANFNAVVGTSEAEVGTASERIRARQFTKANPEAVDGMLSTITSAGLRERNARADRRTVDSRMRDLGCEYAILNFPEAAYDRSGIEQFEREVIPALS